MDKKIEQLEKQIEEMKKTIRDLFLFFVATSVVFIGASLIDTKNYAVIILPSFCQISGTNQEGAIPPLST